MKDMMDRLQLQSNEFNALEDLIKKYKNLPPIVDDDYPEARHYYESALRSFLEAVKHNGKTQEITVEGSRAVLKQYMSIPHISTINFARALRWHPLGLESWSESDWACALAGEVGELCNVIKKRNRVRDHMQQRATNEGALQHNLKMEIGDVYIYLDLLARRVGLNLEDCVRDTFNRISEREDFPERL